MSERPNHATRLRLSRVADVILGILFCAELIATDRCARAPCGVLWLAAEASNFVMGIAWERPGLLERQVRRRWSGVLRVLVRTWDLAARAARG